MTTSELIDLADYCAETYDLIEKLRNRLDKAYGDIEKDCYSCKHYNANVFQNVFTMIKTRQYGVKETEND